MHAGGVVGRPVHVGAVQGSVPHVVYWVRALAASECHRRLAHHDQHAHWSYLLRALRRPRHYPHTVLRHFQEAVPGEGRQHWESWKLVNCYLLIIHTVEIFRFMLDGYTFTKWKWKECRALSQVIYIYNRGYHQGDLGSQGVWVTEITLLEKCAIFRL